MQAHDWTSERVGPATDMHRRQMRHLPTRGEKLVPVSEKQGWGRNMGYFEGFWACRPGRPVENGRQGHAHETGARQQIYQSALTVVGMHAEMERSNWF